MSVRVYADDVVVVDVTPDSGVDCGGPSELLGIFALRGAVMHNLFVDNSLNRLCYHRISENGSRHNLDMNSGIEDLSNVQFIALC